MLNNLKKEFPNFVKKTENPDVNTIKIESDSEDSDIEMVNEKFLKFIFSEMDTKIWKNIPLLLTTKRQNKR